MEQARERRFTRSIGVSNFSVSELTEVLAVSSSPPVVDQVQFSPFEYRRRLLDVATQQRVAIEAYSPLGTGQHLSNRTVKRIARDIGRTPAQVLIRWSLQKGLVVIPKSTHRERIEENGRVFDFTLSREHMAELDGLDETEGTEAALESRWW
jgi:diketogulonate reductase-like aldo/keto reductase